jgi:hypothetical protein
MLLSINSVSLRRWNGKENEHTANVCKNSGHVEQPNGIIVRGQLIMRLSKTEMCPLFLLSQQAK